MSRATQRCALTVLPIAAFTGMVTPQASAQTQLLRPGVIGWTYGTSGTLIDPDPAWVTVIPWNPFFTKYPRQMTPSGKDNEFIHSVSVLGDLTHRGATRYVLDQRWIDGASKSFELIMTPETVATEENPTWYYDGMGADELTDLVLLDSTEFDVLGQARWSVDGTRIAFQAHRVIDDVSGIFVADVIFGGGGEPMGIDPPVCVVPNGLAPSWGNSDKFAYYKDSPGDTSVYVIDVTDPIEIPIPGSLGARDVISFSGGWSGPIPSAAALSHDGNRVAYSRVDPITEEADIWVYDIFNDSETQVTDRSRITPTCLNSNNSPDRWIWSPEWSPDDEKLVFVAYWCGPAQSYSPGGTLFTISVNGTETAKKITRAYVGAPSTVVNFYIRAMWRGDVAAVPPPVDPPVAPTALSATALSSSQIQLNWVDNSSNEDGFQVERSLDGVAWSQVSIEGPGVTTYSDTGLTASTDYHYQVRAFNAGGNSPYSSAATAMTQAGGGVPTTMHVASIDLSTVNIGQGRKSGQAAVLILDDQGSPVPNAFVTGDFLLDYNETVIAETDANGMAVLTTVGWKKGGVSFQLCVAAVTGSLTYDDAADVVTCPTY